MREAVGRASGRAWKPVPQQERRERPHHADRAVPAACKSPSNEFERYFLAVSALIVCDHLKLQLPSCQRVSSAYGTLMR